VKARRGPDNKKLDTTKGKKPDEQATQAPPETKRGRGRPSKYDPDFCQQVVTFGRDGMGKAEIAYELGVDRSTLDEWSEKHEDFSGAISRAREASLGWWMKTGRLGVHMGKQFNSQAYSLQVRNRFPEDFENDGGDGSVTVQIVRFGKEAKAT
jgi:hypothetical protein